MNNLVKHLRILTVAIAAIVAMYSSSASAQFTPEIRKHAVAEMSRQLPMEVATGMVWTKCTLNQSGTVMIWTFTINPDQMGTSLSAAKTEFNNMTSESFKAMLGKEFQEVLNAFGCDVESVITFPDNTSKKFLIRQ